MLQNLFVRGEQLHARYCTWRLRICSRKRPLLSQTRMQIMPFVK